MTPTWRAPICGWPYVRMRLVRARLYQTVTSKFLNKIGPIRFLEGWQKNTTRLLRWCGVVDADKWNRT